MPSVCSLLDRGRLDVDDLGRRLVNWLDWGYLAVDDRVFDVGVQTARAIDAMRSGVPAVDAGPKAQENNGNGSLMRVLPLALVHRGTDEELARAAMLQSRVTHGHAWSQGCCALYVVWARRVLAGSANAYDEALAITRPLLDDDLLRQLDDEPRGTGFVIDTLRSARAALRHESYEDVVRAAIAFGNDTDTTAAVAGGLAGLRSGLSGIPLRWIERLRGRELVDPLVERLLAL
jgi:ADP-ribosylglycohydrolase